MCGTCQKVLREWPFIEIIVHHISCRGATVIVTRALNSTMHAGRPIEHLEVHRSVGHRLPEQA